MTDKAFAIKTMGKYCRTEDKEVLDEIYELSIKTGFTVPPYLAGIPCCKTWKGFRPKLKPASLRS